MRLGRVGYWLLGVAVLIAAVAVGAWHYGLRGAADWLLAGLAQNYRLGSITRNADGSIEVRDLTLIDRDWRLGIRDARLRFDIAALLKAPRRIVRVDVGYAALWLDTRRPRPTRPLDLPALGIDALQIQRLQLRVNDIQIDGEALRGELQLAGRTVDWRRGSGGLRVAGQQFALAQTQVRVLLEVPRRVALTMQWRRIDATAPASGQLQLAGPLGELRGRLRVQQPLVVNADVVITDRSLHGHVAQLAFGAVVLRDLRAVVTPGPRPFPIQVVTGVELPGLGALRVHAGAAWTGGRLPIVAHVTARGQRARVAGNLDPADWHAQLRITASDVNAAAWVDGADSALALAGTIDSHVLRPFHANLQLAARGQLLRRPVRGDVELQVDENGVRIPRAELRNHANHALVQQTSLGFAATLQLRDLGSLARGWRGNVMGDVDWTAGEAARARIDLRGRDVALADLRAARLDVTGDVALQGAVALRANARGLALAGYGIDSAQLDIGGTADSHTATFSLGAPQATLEGFASGSWREQTWRGRVDNSRLTTRDYGSWQQRGSVDIVGRSESVRATALCFDGSATAYVCAQDLSWRAGASAATLQARNLPLGLLPIATLATFDVRGLLDVDAAWRNGVLQADVTGQGISARLNRQRVDIEVARGNVRWPIGTAPAELQATLGSSVLGGLEVTTKRAASGALDGQLRANLRDLGFLQVLLADVRGVYIEGRATADLRIGGSLAAPRLDGTGNVLGRVRLPALGTSPLPLRLDLQGDGAAVGISGNLGSARIAGTIALPELTAPRLQATLEGERMRLIDRPDLKALVSPALRIDAGLHSARVDGSLRIDDAELGFAGDQVTSGLSDDVVIHDPTQAVSADATAATAPYDWRADVRVLLGDAVRFRAAGLRTRLTGELDVTARPRQPLRVLGFVDTVDGTFDTYGVRLTVQQGRLDFDGPADNPRVDARAVRRLGGDDKNLVGVRIRGPLRRMQTELFAEPPRPTADTLALLITGRTFGSGDAADLEAIGQAGLALGVLDALPLTARLRDSLGLDELEVRGALDRSTSEVRVGKQLTRRLRARYVYSVFNRTGGLQLRYQITDSLSLQTEAGAETSAIDVLWEWQADSANGSSNGRPASTP